LERTKVGGRNLLLGVFIGVPKTKKMPYHTAISLPDRIELYQKNIEALCHTPEEIKKQIQDTIKHEIGHYFGLSERELRET